MGLEAIAAAAIFGTLASTGMAVAQGVRGAKEPKVPDPAFARAEAARKEAEKAAARRGRASTLATPPGGLSESPTLGRPSLLGA